MRTLKRIRKRNPKMAGRLRRKIRIRKRIFGTAERPRFCMFRSAKHIYAQIIDDDTGRTIVAASSLDKELREQLTGLKKSERAAKVGELVAERCKAHGIEAVVFDRSGFRYHGRVKALADGARGKGLKF